MSNNINSKKLSESTSRRNNRAPLVPGPSFEETSKYSLYMLYSTSGMTKLRTFIEHFDDFPDEGATTPFMRIDYVKDRESKENIETNRSVVLMKTLVGKALLEKYSERTGYDFVIAPYAIRAGNHPPTGTAYAFFIPLPENVCKDDAEEQLHLKMQTLVKYNIISPKDYTVHFPNSSREEKPKEESRCHAIVTFSGRVNRDDIARIKVLMDMTRWYGKDADGKEDPSFCHVAWLRSKNLQQLNSTRTNFKHKSFETTRKPRVVKTVLSNSHTSVAKPVVSKKIDEPINYATVSNSFRALDDEEDKVIPKSLPVAEENNQTV